MTELTSGIFNAAKGIYNNNKGSILRTIVYTIGHFAIAITVLMIIADVPFMIALTDAIVEPLANAVWYFLLDKFWASKNEKLKDPQILFFKPSFKLTSFNFTHIFTINYFYQSSFFQYGYWLRVNCWTFKHQNFIFDN